MTVGELFPRADSHGLDTAVTASDARAGAQQRRRDALTRSARHIYCLVGAAVTLTAIVLVVGGTTSWWGILVIPAYWAVGHVIADLAVRLALDPWLDARFPLSRSSVFREFP